MIKDLMVNLAMGAERDPAREYALTIADVFQAHTVGLAFIYDYTCLLYTSDAADE